ncbi:hypothetical protein K458DRAFT_407072 [Lentithecium fluviatile CBS 122367]|uniref:Copper acquisition factor BIM1-like domain-containing protein n=1 Tax=Lentithecium fluviatile CBS 122367 TaxID=1168545 RepID=A0A6G1ISK7_9PLEO|nr:hypothetical protein K458DRAFT_407072 [Lentithecium fluviatile CBS 122367]
MLSFIPLIALAGLTSAHFNVLAPTWRGNSFTGGASQWIYPCANVSETTDPSNRTQWPHTGGSVKINGSHEWAYTYVNLGLGTNATNFNISLVEGFNQTGKGILCMKEVGRDAIMEGIMEANISMEAMEGMHATVQIIQITHSGASLYNCADITFNSTAQLLSDSECANSTGVSGVALANAGATSGATARMGPAVGGGLLAALIAWGLL